MAHRDRRRDLDRAQDPGVGTVGSYSAVVPEGIAPSPGVRSLFGLGPSDPATLLAAALVLAVVGLAAAGLPARRAARIDPAEVLREG